MTIAVLEKKLRPFREPIKNRLMQFLLSNFPPQPIQTAAMHRHYSEVVSILLEALETQSFPAENREAILKFVKLISPLIQDFERHAHPIPEADPITLLEFLMDQHNLKQDDLAGDIGGQSVVSELLNRKRKLNVDQIAKLSTRFNISPASFFPGR